MSTTNIDEGKLNAFIGQMLSDLGGASSIAMVRLGDTLGLYRAIHANGPMTSMELAKAAKVDERYLREWLSHQAASNYLSYDPATAKFAMPPEQAMVFANEESPVYMMGGFDLMAAMLDNQPKVQAAFKSGAGVAWGDQAGCMFCAVARFFRPGYHNNLVSSWLPALDGVVKKLEAGARVADVGCGHGWSTVLMAKAFPKSQFFGYDFHPELDPRRHCTREGPWRRCECALRRGPCQRLRRQGFRSRHMLRLSARHGRSCRRGSTHPSIPEIRRDLDDRGADGRRYAATEPEPGRTPLLRGLYHDLPADFTVAGGWGGSRCTSGRSEIARDHPKWWLFEGAPGRGDAFQHDPGGAALGNLDSARKTLSDDPR